MADLWKLAAKWLHEVGVLPKDCSALADNARVYEFALELQVGLLGRPRTSLFLAHDLMGHATNRCHAVVCHRMELSSVNVPTNLFLAVSSKSTNTLISSS
jgi:hypothetical protein